MLRRRATTMLRELSVERESRPARATCEFPSELEFRDFFPRGRVGVSECPTPRSILFGPPHSFPHAKRVWGFERRAQGHWFFSLRS